MTVGLYEPELTARALEALRQQPGCADVRMISLYGLPGAAPGTRNWEIALAGSSLASIPDVNRAAIVVQYRLSRHYHLIMDN
jgi:hypothetical protein